MSDADRAAWAAFAGSIRPLPGRTAPALPAAGAESLDPGTAAPPVEAPRARAARTCAPRVGLVVGKDPGGLDRGSWLRLSRGRLSPQRRLDLHGRTAQGAFRALEAFLHAAHADRVRCVEVITGRGSGEGGGVIRRELPLWLNLPSLRPLVLAASHAHPGNPGAVRVLLRRAR